MKHDFKWITVEYIYIYIYIQANHESSEVCGHLLVNMFDFGRICVLEKTERLKMGIAIRSEHDNYI